MFQDRTNSPGLDLTEQENIDELKLKLSKFDTSKIDAVSSLNRPVFENEVRSLCDGHLIGSLKFDDPKHIKTEITSSLMNDAWAKTNIKHRAKILNTVAALLQKNSDQLLYLLIHETGKTIHDAWD